MDFGKATIGLELGSTRIKAVLLDEKHVPVASGAFEWENQLVNGVWTYSLDTVRQGVEACFAALKAEAEARFGQKLTRVGAIGVSGMMHGYLPFDAAGGQLAAFRTWRNTITGEAAAKLTELFSFNVPQRWSIAHLYQAILNGEPHVKEIAQLTTLTGYQHYLLTGERVMGVGEASGMFPIDSATLDYDETMLRKFDAISAMPWKLRDILPRVLPAGEIGGYLTEAGARYLDPTGDLLAGIPVAPCEGDAGTGMVASNAVRVGTGNVSAGTSDFAMIVTDRMPGVHREIDMVTTPAGAPVAMVHCNNCTSDINAWVGLFGEFAELVGAKISRAELFPLLFRHAMKGEADGGGLVSYNYFSGEGITDLDEGRPLLVRKPDARFTLANLMRMHLLSALATLKEGLDILCTEEKIRVEKLTAHGGFFKTPAVGQTMLSAAIGVPVTVTETAGEGGPYGMALLAAYMIGKERGESLADYLDRAVFREARSVTLTATEEEIAGFERFLASYRAVFAAEKAAVEHFR